VSFYGEDLAYVHDAGFTSLAALAADRLIEELHRLSKGGLVVELGAGSGVAAARLGAAGFDVLGIDASPAMIQLARENAPRATFVEESFVTADIPPCDAVLAVGEVFNSLDDRANTAKALDRVFTRVFKALWPGGVFLFDVAGPGRVAGGEPVTTTWVGEDCAVVSTVVEYAKRSTLTRSVTTLRKVGGRIRTAEETHEQRLIPAARVLEQLRKAGFKVRTLQGYDGERFAPGHSVFLARRP
jgi:SAM-dependent methyltransferase